MLRDLTPRARELKDNLLDYMDRHVYPSEAVYEEQHRAGDRWDAPPVLEELKGRGEEGGACGTCSCPRATMAPG